MIVQYGPYVLMGVITVIALALAVLVGFMVYHSLQEKKEKEAQKSRPRDDTLANQIKEQFKENEQAKERYIYTNLGVSKTKVKQTRSVFSFHEEDTEQGLSLESKFDNGPETPFVPPEEKI